MNKRSLHGGEGDNMFLVGIAAFILLLLVSGGSGSDNSSSSKSVRGSGSSSEEISSTGFPYSPWKDKIYLSKGNTSATESYKEYIYIKAKELPSEGVSISGWSLSNNKDGILHNQNGNIVRRAADTTILPFAAKFFLPSGNNYQSPIILKSKEKAIVVSGSFFFKGAIKINSFQVNKCSGYIEKLENYDFVPKISSSCPAPRKESGVNTLEEECYRFVRGIGSCHTPEFEERIKVGDDFLRDTVDGKDGLSRQCQAFLKSHYSYSSCIALHGSDSDFYKPEWRVFLHRPFELWAKDREVITLYDSSGLVVDEISY